MLVLVQPTHTQHVVLRAARDLSPPGELTSQQLLPFEFNSVEMEHDSYRGLQVRLRWGS